MWYVNGPLKGVSVVSLNERHMYTIVSRFSVGAQVPRAGLHLCQCPYKAA